MASLNNLQQLISRPVVDPEPVVVPEPNEEHPTSEEPEVYYLYPYRTKTEAAKELKDYYDGVVLPDKISLRTTLIKDLKNYIATCFDLVKKYWRDDRYIKDRLSDLKTIKEYVGVGHTSENN